MNQKERIVLKHHSFHTKNAANLEIWNQLAEHYNSTFPIDILKLDQTLNTQDFILDYGCGNGRVLKWLSNNGYRNLIGCDASYNMCLHANALNPQTTIRFTADPIDPPVSENEFDVVLVIGVLSSVISKQFRSKLISNLIKSLKVEGTIILADFGRSTDPDYLNKYCLDIEDSTYFTEEGLYIHHFSALELEELLLTSCKTISSYTKPVTTSHNKIIPGHVIIAKKDD